MRSEKRCSRGKAAGDTTTRPSVRLAGSAASGLPPARHAGECAPPPRAGHCQAFDGAGNVSNAYGYYIDQFAWRHTAALFATDGWKELSYIGTFIGRDRVTNSMIQRYGENGASTAMQTLHQKVQPYITVLGDGTRAQARLRLLQMNSASTSAGSMIFGVYENQIVRNGVWRIHGGPD